MFVRASGKIIDIHVAAPSKTLGPGFRRGDGSEEIRVGWGEAQPNPNMAYTEATLGFAFAHPNYDQATRGVCDAGFLVVTASEAGRND